MSTQQVVVVGSCNLDLIVEVPRLPAPGETTLGADAVARPGGKGANQAVAARRLGARTAFVGALGNDQFGATLRTALDAADLELTGLVSLEGASGIALILVDPHGQNVIAVSSGANRHLGVEHLTALPQQLDRHAVLLLQLETPLPTCLAAARAARRAGARVIVNAAPMPAISSDLEALLGLTDVLVVNEGEALALAGAGDPDGAGDWPALARRLRGHGPDTVVLTLGADGAVLAEADSTCRVPAPKVEAIDSTGAGDAFCGALAATLSAGWSLDRAVRQACLAGSFATTAVGAQTALPMAADLEHFDALQAGG